MSAQEVVKALAGVGIHLHVDGGRLKFDAPKGTYTAEKRRLVDRHRGEIMALLAAPVAVDGGGKRVSAIDKTRPADLRAHLWAAVGDQSLVERYGAAAAGELLALVQRWEKWRPAEVEKAYWETWLAAEAAPRPVVAQAIAPAPAAPKVDEREVAAVPVWEPALHDLVAWCLRLDVEELPCDPFTLWPGNTVVDGVRFLAALKADIAQGPRGPRAIAPGLERDLYHLREAVNRANEAF